MTEPRGLTSAEVSERVSRGQVNVDRPPVDRTYRRILVEHALPPVNVALYAVSIALLLMGLETDALVTAGPVLAYVLIGIWQEMRAKRKLDAIALLHRPRATVLRDGVERDVAIGAIVLDDLLLVRRGDELVIDGGILQGEIEADEGIISGESAPVVRRVGDRVSSGSVCVSGRAIVRADRIGSDSISARMLRSARAIRSERTPVQQTLHRVILAVTLVIALAGVGVASRFIGAEASAEEGARAAAVLVALVPQGLLVIVTITYAVAALQLTRRGALVQRTSSIEAMSYVDTLCIDKTGTLTTGHIRLVEVEPLDDSGQSDVAAVAASMEPPNDTILAVRAARGGTARPTSWQMAFSSSRRWSALRFADAPEVHVLGAPDALLASVPARRRRAVESRVAELAATGRRVLLYARAATLADPPSSLPVTLEPVTLLGFAEELRPDARSIIRGINNAGVELKMISGDDPRTLQAVATAAGIATEAPAVAAADLAGPDEALTAALVHRSLFGRVDPPTKARFVALLRAAGRYVAMIGDGVNDILALKRAQLGIAMQSGSPATRAASDIVLLRDDFTLLPAILLAGQRVVAAMTVSLELLLARTFSMILIVTLAAVLALPFPFTPRNNSLLALLTVGIPTMVLALAVAPARPPDSILRSGLRFALPSGLGIGLPAVTAYALALALSGDVALSRTVLLDLTVFFGIGLITLVARRWTRPVMPRAQRWQLWALAAAMAAIFALVLGLPPVRAFFDLAPMPPALLGLMALLGIAWTVAAHLVADVVAAVIGRVERRLGQVSSGV